MNYAYNPLLVFVSILVAIIGAYACFDLTIRVQRSEGVKRQQWLALASLAIGGSIWSMHFIAMVAVDLNMVMQYDKLLTLVSGLASILMTAVALAIVSTGKASRGRILLGGTVLGVGVVCMHYVGMSGMRGNFKLMYEPFWVGGSVLIGMVASSMSLWLVLRLRLRGVKRRLSSAFVMGLSIAGVHYSAMFGTSFEAVAAESPLSSPSLDPVSLGMITALVTFGLLAWTLLSVLPDTTDWLDAAIDDQDYTNEPRLPVVDAPASTTHDKIKPSVYQQNDHNGDTGSKVTDDESSEQDSVPVSDASDDGTRVPVQRNKETHFVAVSDIASISADGHYCNIKTADASVHFCNVGFNKLLENLHSDQLVRVHRSHAVNLKHIVSFQRQHDKGVLSMGEDKHKITVSRSYVPAIKTLLGLSKVK